MMMNYLPILQRRVPERTGRMEKRKKSKVMLENIQLAREGAKGSTYW